jgi:MshEN domain
MPRALLKVKAAPPYITAYGPERECNMAERNSPADKFNEISLRDVAIDPRLQGIIGEKYCSANRIVVLKDTPSEITVAAPEQSLLCIDEIRKVLPREKRIDFILGDLMEIEWAFARGYDLYDFNHSH